MFLQKSARLLRAPEKELKFISDSHGEGDHGHRSASSLPFNVPLHWDLGDGETIGRVS